VKVTIFSTQHYEPEFFDHALEQLGHTHPVELAYEQQALSARTAPLAQGSDAVSVLPKDTLDATVLELLAQQHVRAIFLRSAGFDHVDVEAASRLGLFVARVPAYSPEAIAEHALALVMTLNRHMHRAWLRVREGNLTLDGLMGTTLHGKTVGIVGAGRIGLAAARIFHGMGCRVLGFDRAPVPALAQLGEQVPLEALLRESDVVSLHCPLSDDTKYLINRESLAAMKRGAMLVNTSRGPLIDTAAAVESLKARHLGALAIDVYEHEEALFFVDHSSEIIGDDLFRSLLTFPNVLVTCHQGFFTTEAIREIAHVTLDNVRCFMTGSECANRVGAG
jgi:D-lactate dehydrogenase